VKHLIREYKSLAECQVKKAYACFCFDDEDSSEDDIDYCILAELAVLKSSQYCLQGSYRQWDSNWERMLEDGTYITDDEFLSNFHMDRSCVMQLNSLFEYDEVFWRVYVKLGKRSSMLHIMVLLKFLGSCGNAVTLQKIGHMMGILKGSVNDYVMQACNAILKHHDQIIK